MSELPLKIGLVGVGGFGAWFAPYLAEIGVIVAVSDPSERARRNFKEGWKGDVSVYESHEELLDSESVNAVVICGPNHTHKEITLAAASRKKHVFCEKAMALNVADCWEMVRACDSAGVCLMVGHKRRLRPPWARMLELRKDVGEVTSISVVGYFDSRPDGFSGWWTKKAQCGGVLMLAGIHEIDWMRAMCGEVRSVSALYGPQNDLRYDFSDSMQVMLRFRSGAVGSLGVSLSYPLLRYRQVCGAEVVTAGGGMRLLSSFQGADVFWEKAEGGGLQHEVFVEETDAPVGAEFAIRKELRDFQQWVLKGTRPCLTWVEGLKCVEVIEAAYQSADAGGSAVVLPQCD